jgi:hypothetical protein
MPEHSASAAPLRFKALVLTYDRNAAVAEHMMRCYDAIWPEHPFEFRIPYQDRAMVADGTRRCLVQSPPSIKSTVDALLAGLPDDEWVYWCIDDKYPIELNQGRVSRIAEAIRDGQLESACAVLFCRVRRLLDPANLTGEHVPLGSEVLLRRRGYHQLWIHQFMRVKVLRHVFKALPEGDLSPRALERHKDLTPLPADHALYVTQDNLAGFGESTHEGILTSNCIASMQQRGVAIPQWQPPTAWREILIGVSRHEPTA